MTPAIPIDLTNVVWFGRPMGHAHKVARYAGRDSISQTQEKVGRTRQKKASWRKQGSRPWVLWLLLGRAFQPGHCRFQWNDVGCPFDFKPSCRVKRFHSGDPCRLFYSQAGLGSELILRRKSYTQGASFGVEFQFVKSTSIERKPKPIGREIDSGASGIEWRDLNHIADCYYIASEPNPAELRMIDYIRGGVPCMSKKVWTVIA